MDQAVDSASQHTQTSAKALADAGIKFALRYHYNATKAEVDTLHAAGVGFSLIGEFDTTTPVAHPPMDTPKAGGDHAAKAVAVAQQIKLPTGCTIWMTADVDVAPSQLANPRTYWGLAAPVIRAAGYLCGAYGGSTVIDDLHAQGLVDRTWEAGATSWSTVNGTYIPSKTACLRQFLKQPTFGGVQVDMNDILGSVDDCGVWMPGGTDKPIVKPPPPPQDETMAITFMREDSEPAVWIVRSDGTRSHVVDLKTTTFIMSSLNAKIMAPPAGVKTETDPSSNTVIWICADGALSDFPIVSTEAKT